MAFAKAVPAGKSEEVSVAVLESQMIDLKETVNQRFVEVDKHFDRLEQQISNQTVLICTMFGTMMAGLFALFGYIVWDRRSMTKPLEKESHAMREVLRGIAQHDPRVHQSMQQQGLL